MSENTTADDGSEVASPEKITGGVQVHASDPNVDISENSGPADLHYLVVNTEAGAESLARFAAAALKGETLSVNDIDQSELEAADLEQAFEEADDD
ncbi:hypothetical protein AFNJKBDN_CDS0022 [Halorubrum virus V_ICIS4]|nr:hypothetical protein AFNJKBDN_CDS0022 [Halorubrum virus V_ICIS4]